jgi:hypothetical protein
MDSAQSVQVPDGHMPTTTIVVAVRTHIGDRHPVHRFAQNASMSKIGELHQANARAAEYNLGGGQGVQSCGNNIYCCAANYDCCTNSTSIFSLSVANIVTTIPAMGDSKTSSTAAPNSTSAAQAPSTTAIKSTSERATSNAVIMGVGVGVGVGGFSVFLLALTFLFRYKRRRTSIADTTELEDTPELDTVQPSRLSEPDTSRGELNYVFRTQGLTQEMCGEPTALIPKEPQELEHKPLFELQGER